MQNFDSISRKEFMKLSIGTAVFLTAPELAKLHSIGNASSDNSFDDPANKFETPILNALNTGITAPNPHNTQAWKFKILNNREALLYVDQTRVLPETDPTTRQIHIAQGTFLAHTKLGANHIGYQAKWTLFPNGTYPIVRTGSKPVAHIKLTKRSAVRSHYWYNNLAKRRTTRTPYFGPPITNEEFQLIVKASLSKKNKALLIDREEAIEKYYPLLKKSFTLEMNTYQKNEESRLWFRLTNKDIYSKRDGITLEGNGVSGLKLFFAKNFFFSLKPGTFHSKNSIKYACESFNHALDKSSGLVLISTPGNTMFDWVNAGIDFARFQLEITSKGMALQPLSQILQEYKEMKPLYNQFINEFSNSVKGRGKTKVQMIVRIGRSKSGFRTPRRKMESFIDGAKT